LRDSIIVENTFRRTIMPQSTQNRVAELHNLAIHAHEAAAAAHNRGDHLIAHELTKRTLEHTINAFVLAEKLSAKAVKSVKRAA
jgi:hypothetical protein